MSINHFKFTCQLENWPTRDLISSSAKSMVLLLLERSTHHSDYVNDEHISPASVVKITHMREIRGGGIVDSLFLKDMKGLM